MPLYTLVRAYYKKKNSNSILKIPKSAVIKKRLDFRGKQRPLPLARGLLITSSPEVLSQVTTKNYQNKSAPDKTCLGMNLGSTVPTLINNKKTQKMIFRSNMYLFKKKFIAP